MDELLNALNKCNAALIECANYLRVFKLNATDVSRAKELQAQAEFRCAAVMRDSLEAERVINELLNENKALRLRVDPNG